MKIEIPASFYLAFSRIYLFPEKEMLSQVEALPWQEDMVRRVMPGAEVDRLLKAVQNHHDDRAMKTLAESYTRLFINAPENRALPPYESLYQGGNAQLLGKPAQVMKALLEKYEMDIAEDPQLMPDHLAVELEVLAYLLAVSEKEGLSCPQLKADIASMASRILNWVRPYHKQLLLLDPPDLYRVSGNLLSRLLEYHSTRLV